MQRGLTLTDLARKLEGQKPLKQDFVIPANKMRIVINPGDKTEAARPVLALPDGHGEFPILSLAHDQIGTFTKIPAPYYDRMLADAPDLLARNVNHWFETNGTKRMVRTLGGDARALLSNSYQRIENFEVAEVVIPILMDLKAQIVSCEVTERRLYIHFTFPHIKGHVGPAKVGDILQAGGIVRNSEVGCGSVAVEGLLWRLICLNGMKTTDAFRRAHIGRRVEDNEALWAEDTRKADDNTVLLKVRDMVKAVSDQARFAQHIEKVNGLTEGKITGDPAKAVEVLSQKLGATEGERGGILRSLIEGGDLSRWGILNAVTAQAHTAKSYDRAVEFEGMGGALVELAAGEWKQVLEAA